MNISDQKSKRIFHNNIKWLLSSDIRIKKGPNKGALYGWKNFNPVSFPFIYSEITGYGITAYLWIYSELKKTNALKAAKDCSDWIIKNMKSYMLIARPSTSDRSDQMSNLYYAFDNGMIITGLLHLYKLTLDAELLAIAKGMGEKIIKHFFDGTKLTARLDKSYNPIVETINDGIVKWSTISGSYHAKLSLGLLELSRLTDYKRFKQVSNSICNYAISVQKSNGQFITNPESDITYLHPHLYSCEGLIYSGLNQAIHSHYSAGLKGIKWAMEQFQSSAKGGLRSNTGPDSVEQSDCTAQLLRLIILCRPQLEKLVNNSEMDDVINKLHLQLFDFYIPSGHDQGGMRYHFNLDTACSWCTMFSMQALSLWRKRHSEKQKWIEYFV